MHFQKITLFFTALVVLFSAGCSSQYHWIKLKSEDPHLIRKMDEPSTSMNYSEITEKNPILSLPEKSLVLSSPLATKDHGFASLSKEAVIAKSREIENSLDEVRKSEIQSHNPEVQKLAIQKTVHEQLLKNPYFSKLSSQKQVKFENHVNQRWVNKARGYRGGGVNALLVLGLILLLLSLLFIGSGTIAIIGVLFSVILIILGLVQGIL